MSIIGPTLIRVVTEDDFVAYLDDADAAGETARFVEFATFPAVLADLPGLGAGYECDGPRLRLYVAGSGEVSASPAGLPLGTLDDGMDSLGARWDQINEQSSHPALSVWAAP